MAKHALLFIHGMGDTNQSAEFDALKDLIRKSYDRRSAHKDGDFDREYEACFVDWHEPTDLVERRLFDDAFGPMRAVESLPLAFLHPLAAARTFFTFYLGDVIAYVDESDNGIRRTVWKGMQEALKGCERFSIVAHSLGTIIAFDFLYHLLEKNSLFSPIEDPENLAITLREKFAGLYTMGSPVGLFMLRRADLWNANAANGENPDFSKIHNPIPGDRVWKNFWDEQDIIAYPLERLFAHNQNNNTRSVSDIKVNTGVEPVSAHIGYLKSNAVAREIAASLA